MTVVVVAVSALCSLAIPNEEFGAPFRLLKFGFILLGGWLGIFGMVLGTFLLAGHLAGLTSLAFPILCRSSGKDLRLPCAEGFRMAACRMHQMRERPVLYKARSESAAAEKQKSCRSRKKNRKGESDACFRKMTEFHSAR